MFRIISLMLIALFVSACASEGAKSMRMTANASFGCSSSNYKDKSVYQGSEDDSCGYKVVGRVGGGVMQPIRDIPEKGEPIDSGGRPVNTLEAEVGFVRFGDMKFDGIWGGFPDTGTIEANGIILGVVYTRRLSDEFDIFVSAGMNKWDVEESEVFNSVPYSSSSSGTSPYYGLGVRYWLHSNIGIRAAWRNYSSVGEKDQTGEGDIRNMSLGVDYLF